MTDAFFQAAFCQPPKVAGRQLRPFSLSHVVLLNGMGSGFLDCEKARRSDFLAAVLICSRTHKQNAKALFGGRQGFIRLVLWSLLWPNSRLVKERAVFKTYLADYTTMPEHWDDGTQGAGFRCPWTFHFAMNLTSHFGHTMDEAWNAPVGLARCLYDVWAETQGDKSLISEREHKLSKAVNEQ